MDRILNVKVFPDPVKVGDVINIFIFFVKYILIFSVKSSGDQLEFGIEMLGSVETYGFTYLHFEGQNIHDRKLWIQKLNEAIKNYKDKADLDKSKKESGKQ